MSFVTSIRTRQNAVAVTLCAAVLMALSACTASTASGSGGLAAGGASANPTAAPSVGGSASATATSAGTPTATPTTQPPATHTYPSDYGAAILAAWKAHDTAYLTLLTTATIANQIYAFGDINQVWTSLDGTGGSGAAGTTYWEFYNNAGDYIRFRTGNVATGAHQWHAGSVDLWDQMTFPSDPELYVKRFVDGWIDGNVARMKLLSNDAITAQFNAITARPDLSYTVAEAPGGAAAGSQYFDVTETDPSFHVTIQVTSQFLGHEHAIASCQSGC
jgi:hypothetical protein